MILVAVVAVVIGLLLIASGPANKALRNLGICVTVLSVTLGIMYLLFAASGTW